MRAASAFFPNMDTCWAVPNLNFIHSVWFSLLTCSDGFFLLCFLVIPALGVWRETNDAFHGQPQKWKVARLSCQRLKRSTNLTSLDSNTGAKRQSGNWHTPCSHLRECPLLFSLCAKCRCCCLVPENNNPMDFFYVGSSCNKNEHKNRMWKITLFKNSLVHFISI